MSSFFTAKLTCLTYLSTFEQLGRLYRPILYCATLVLSYGDAFFLRIIEEDLP
jgi:hypothetical protein